MSSNDPSSSIPPVPSVPPVPPVPAPETPFVDRRNPTSQRKSGGGLERRQFTNSHSELSPDAAELGAAIDQYKLLNRRRYITYEEMLAIVKSLGYRKS